LWLSLALAKIEVMNASKAAPTDIFFRPATADDWPRIAELVKDTWEDGDYIDQDVWREWTRDPESRLEAGTRDGQIVAFARLLELGPAEWWLEGVRVGRAYQRQGIGRVLIAHMIETFTQTGIGLLRFAISSQNEAMARLAREFDFRPLVSYAPLQAPARPADYRNFKVLQAQNLDIAYQYLRRSPMNRVNHFAEYRWTLYYMTQERLSQYLADPHQDILAWRQFDQVYGLAILFPDPDRSGPLRLGYLDAGDDTTALAMLEAVQGLAARRGYSKVAWKMPVGLGLERRITTTDYTRRYDYDLSLYERPLRL
jgi:GNAT superfamily N-acetyltransferase